MEFNEKDYEGARDCANKIKTNAENIMKIFDDIDKVMTGMYDNNWRSSGADDTRVRYDQIKSNYILFYNSVMNMHSHVHKVTDKNQATDNYVSEQVSGV